MDRRKTVPTLVKRLRSQLRLTQEQFAHAVGVTYSTVNHWENGKRAPQPFLLNRLLEMEASLDRDRPRGKKRGGRSRRER